VLVPELAIGAIDPPDPETLRKAIDGADLLIVDNVCSLPLNVEAARTVARIGREHAGRVCFRHHDLPWQRRNLTELEREFPPHLDGALHATINLRSRRELEARGYSRAVTLHNYFDLDPPPGDRDATRERMGFAPGDFVLFQPARAIERKNIPGGLRFAQRLAQLIRYDTLRYWVSGPAEDGYGPTLDRLIERAPLPVTLGRVDAADGYAACDLVAFPSTWEGFGNPVIESIAWRRPCAAAPYPVLAEILATGVRALSTERPEQVAQFLEEPAALRDHYYDVNLRRARLSYDLADLPKAIDAAFAAHGWTSW
jgi:glycosyltransferase involved in cell wall biosynthesis